MNRRSIALVFAAAVLIGCQQDMADMSSPSHDKPVVAEPATDIRVQPVGQVGKVVRLSDKKGKVVLIDFWATWCGPCRELMPTVQDLYKRYQSKGLEVMAISDEDDATVSKFIKANDFTYPMYLDFTGMAHGAYKVDSIPETIVIDRKGNILYKSVGYDPIELENAVMKALGTSA